MPAQICPDLPESDPKAIPMTYSPLNSAVKVRDAHLTHVCVCQRMSRCSNQLRPSPPPVLSVPVAAGPLQSAHH